MNLIVKKKWIDALRSNYYLQGFLYLRNSDDRFNAHGVLCDLYSKNVVDEPWIDYSDIRDSERAYCDNCKIKTFYTTEYDMKHFCNECDFSVELYEVCDYTEADGGRTEDRELSYLYDKCRFVLPEFVYEWAGLSGPDPYVGKNRLTYLNSYLRFSFEEIAELIDKEM